MGHILTAWPKRLSIIFLLLLPFVFPFASRAETANLRAGFAQSAIWLSRSHVVAGDTVNIFTVLYNSSENSISGDVVIEVDGSSTGTKSFTLTSGETQVVSSPWLAKVGSHSISARMEKVLDAGTNASAAISDKTTGTITVSVEAAPPPSPSAQILNTVTSAIQTGVASTAPAVLSAAGSAYGAVESFRKQAKSTLEKQLANNSPQVSRATKTSKQNTANNSVNSSTSTEVAASSAPAGGSLLSNALRYAAAAGLVVVSSKTLFYIFLVSMILILLQILRVAFRERKRSKRHLPLD